MTEWIAYSTWTQGRQGDRIARAHVIETRVVLDNKIMYRPACRTSHPSGKGLLRDTHLRFVREVDDLPPRVLPCTNCFKCCDVPYWVAVSKKGYEKPKYKVCSKVNGCGKRKPLTEFSKHPSKKWGRDSICKACAKSRRRFYADRSDNKTLRVPTRVHSNIKEFAASKGLSVQEAVIRALRMGMESMCKTRDCVEPRVRNGFCEKHYRQIVERVA